VPFGSSFTLMNQVVTIPGSEHKIHVWRAPGSSELIVWGTIGVDAPIYRADLAIADPAAFAARAFIEILEEEGISVQGRPRAKYCPSNLADTASDDCGELPGKVIVTRPSAPLWQALQVTEKVSQNLHAEMVLRETALHALHAQTLPSAVDARSNFFHGWYDDKEPLGSKLDDGSGLARQDLTSPSATVALLRHMWASPNRQVWLQLLPTGGVDGSLIRRFRDLPSGAHVYAKTGSLSHVSSLSGYMQTVSGRWLCFSVMVNGSPASTSRVRDFLDSFCRIFLLE
jgi:serine-type D-Ala-D-Ala carboxypeptidase/endopeptidase (penicillin-binding protein 4)